MECDICLIEWDAIVHIPRLLSCGHTICEICLLSMLRKARSKNEEMFCPSCMKKQKDIREENDIRKLIKNINLLKITEKIEIKKTSMMQSFLSSRENFNMSQLMKSTGKKIDQNYKNYERSNLFSLNEIFCNRHGLQVHSYAIITNNYLCDLCLKERPQKSLQLPNYIRETKRKIDSVEVRVCMIKNEIERLQDFFSHYLKEFESSNLTKIEDLFQYLNKLILYNYNTAKTVVAQSMKEQGNQIEIKRNELKEMTEELSQIENKINDIKNNENNPTLFNEDLNEIYNKVNCFINYEMELDLFQMQIGLKENMKEELFNFIQNSYYVDVDFAKINGESPMIKHILQKDKLWQCICGEIENLNSSIKCRNCGIFRKLETFDNLTSNPLYITKEEIINLNMIRKQEVKDFQSIYTNKTLDEKCKFFVLDLEWFLLWKCFVANDMTDKYISNSKKRISPNKSIGVLPPGPINNINLFEKDAKEYSDKFLRKLLKRNDDYIIVNETIWKFFLGNYNANVKIELNGNKDIYTEFIKCDFANYNYEILKIIDKKEEEIIVIHTNTNEEIFNQELNLNTEINEDKEEEINLNKENNINYDLVNQQTLDNYNSNNTDVDKLDLSQYDSPRLYKVNKEETDEENFVINEEPSVIKYNTDKKINSTRQIFLQSSIDEENFDRTDLNSTGIFYHFINFKVLSESPNINPTSNYDFKIKFNHIKLTQNLPLNSPKEAFKGASKNLKIFFKNN